jgi:hypothetical protein
VTEALRPRRRPDLALLTSTIEAAQLSELGPADDGGAGSRRPLELPLRALWLENQPREILPEADLERLIAEGRAQPIALLERLREIATVDSYYAEILEKLEGLARSVAAQGVLQPIEVVQKDGRYVVRDGHRRSLASLIAGRETVPAVAVAEPSELEAVARALIVNLQREDLTALEKGVALLRLALLVADHVEGEARPVDGAPITLEALLGEAPAGDEGEPPPEGTRPAASAVRSRALAAAVRERVCAMTGLQPRSYYRLLALNRLTAEARAVGRSLTEGQLRPLTGLPSEEQPEIVAFVARRGLSSKEAATLAQVARSGDRDAVRRVMARLASEEGPRRRTSVSWETLIHAVPRDLFRRCQALRSELDALPAAHRKVRLDAIWEQDRLLNALREEFAAIFAAHGYSGPGTVLAADDE